MNRYHRYRLKNKAKFVFAMFFILTLLVGGGLWAAGYLDDLLNGAIISGDPAKETDAFRLNVLVLGVDTRKGEKIARADTIMLCSVDTEKNLMSILSIPRDTRVRIPGHGWEKINSATVYGGPNLAMKTVSDLLGVRVNNYVMTNYEGFKDVVDALGGVTIDVKQRMHHDDPEHGGIYAIDLKPGVQRLNGEKALQYVRYRGYPQGDIDRTEQQQKFLSAMVREVLQPATVVKLPSLIKSTYKMVDTNLSLLDMTKLAVAASKMTDANLLTQTLPGKFLNTDEGSYWEVDPNTARLVMAAVYEGRPVDKVVLGSTTVASTNSPGSGSQKNDGKVVPGQTDGNAGVKDSKTGVTGSGATGGSVKAGTSGQTTGKTGASGTQTNSGAPGGKTGTKTGQTTTGGSTGKVVPGNLGQDQQPAQSEPPVTVIITPKTVVN